ncbi:GNAT family N-acetyltransferase [Caldibacillus lycopersici]|uniref:GNAT family N-acetyltransferase n=1 Tax=Perspicuibacillus lycopersici TaxID=1325689 RepID=A0AAE3IVW7_9BACI|nr:GNAT family N-acetyltransferase [Perspicuibacillus lycopersici]MCU9613050.1 GNAT family N-acetyltransferase [Perspicuibacillus lycopersici]
MTEMVRAKQSDFEEIVAMYELCKADLLSKEIYQWDETYPNREYLADCIAEEHLYVLKENERIAGAIVLNKWQAEEWQEISWQFEESDCLIVHTFCIHPDFQRQGLGSTLLRLVEEHAKARGYTSIRLDAFAGNPSAWKFYERKGYEKRGEIRFTFKPEGHQRYYCYEKAI